MGQRIAILSFGAELRFRVMRVLSKVRRHRDSPLLRSSADASRCVPVVALVLSLAGPSRAAISFDGVTWDNVGDETGWFTQRTDAGTGLPVAGAVSTSSNSATDGDPNGSLKVTLPSGTPDLPCEILGLAPGGFDPTASDLFVTIDRQVDPVDFADALGSVSLIGVLPQPDMVGSPMVFGLDSLQFAVPEPGEWAMILTVLGSVVIAVRRARQAA